MCRRTLQNRWQSEAWEAIGVLVGYEGADTPRPIVDTSQETQWVYPGFELVLERNEAEGYFQNVSTGEPRVFVMCRPEGEGLVPHFVTASYDEASRWMDSGEQVDAVRMTPELHVWLAEFVEQNYRPQPKKRIKPQSFRSPKDRARN
jgi:hypothetical protein